MELSIDTTSESSAAWPGRSDEVLTEPGINFFDTANTYSAGSSEEITGRALRDFANRDEIKRLTEPYTPHEVVGFR